MCTSREFSRDLVEYAQRLMGERRYLNEDKPADAFLLNIERDCGIRVKSKEENPDDPPDAFLTLANGEKVNLEVTTFIEEYVALHNQFFKEFEDTAREVIDKNLHLLPSGIYVVYLVVDYLPGSGESMKVTGIEVEVPDLRNRIGKSELKRFLELKIPEFFRNFTSHGKDILPVKNTADQRVGRLSLVKLKEAVTTRCFIQPQRLFRYEKWTLNEFEHSVQKIIQRKEEKYIRRESVLRQNDWPWWLLISDVDGIMGTSCVDFDYSDVRLVSNLFRRVFLIQEAAVNFKVLELSVCKESHSTPR